MLLKVMRRMALAVASGWIMMQGCAFDSESLQQTAATSLELFLTSLLTDALSTWVNTLFGVGP